MVNRILLFAFFALVYSSQAFAAAITFDWKGSSSSTWESSGSWTASDGSTTNYPGSGGRTTDIVRFGMTASFTKQPILATAVTIASIEFGGGYQTAGTQLTVNGVTLTVTTITQDINTTSHLYTIFDYLQGTGTIQCTNIFVGSGTSKSGSNNFMLSDIATLRVSGNVTIVTNVNVQNGCGFRLEDGDMYLTGLVQFTVISGITASNASYFTINTVTQSTGAATSPHLYLASANPLGTIPTPNASVNFYGDHGGVGDVTYTASNPTVYTTATPGFGSGGGTIDTSKASYDNLTIAGTGTATIGNSSKIGALKIAGNLTTNSPATFAPSGALATNTYVGGNWTNTSTITGGAGTTAITGSILNSGPITFSTGNTYVGASLTNSSTITASSGDITVDANLSNTGTLTLSSGDLTIGGNYTNSSIFTAGSGTVYFDGASAEALKDNSTNGTTLNNVDFSGLGVKTLSGTGKFAVSSYGILTMEALTTLQTGDILTLNSASTGSATVAAIPSTASITGKVNVQRYISGGSNTYRGYRLLSSAIYTVKSGSNYYYDLSYLTSFAPITGSLGTAGGLTKSGNPSTYLYRDNVAFTNNTFNTGNFRGVNKINNTPLYQIGVDYDPGPYYLHPGTGFMFFYRGDLTNIATKYILTTSAEPNLFISTGILNQQAVTVTNWYTGSTTLQFSTVAGNAGYTGYNLVGNPYASSIDWDTLNSNILTSTTGIYGPGVGTTIYVFNETAKVYATYNAGVGLNGGSHVIPSGQGFFIKATSGTAQLTFNESAKINTQLAGPTQQTGTTLLLDAFAATAPPQYLRLQLDADSINREETIVRFSPGAKNEFVQDEDSQYLPSSGEVSLSSMTSDNVTAAINNIPYPKSSVSLRLNVNTSVDGKFTLNLTEVKNVPQLFDVWLIDKFKKDSIDLKHNPNYSFNVLKSDTNTYGSNRFSLTIRQNQSFAMHLLYFNATKSTDGAQIAWKTENEEDYTTFTVERSVDNGKTFSALGGFLSNGQANYSLLDKNPAPVTDQYRLKLEDLNGIDSYSKIVSLIYGNQATTATTTSNIMIYPNPTASDLHLSIANSSATPIANSVYGITITGSNGAVVKSASSTQSVWQENVSALLPGTYTIQVVNNNDKSIVGKSKFVKL